MGSRRGKVVKQERKGCEVEEERVRSGRGKGGGRRGKVGKQERKEWEAKRKGWQVREERAGSRIS